MMQDKPLVGIGFGRFNLEWEKYFHYDAKIDFTGFDGSHNTFLTMGAEVGVPTMLAFLLMTFTWSGCVRLVPEVGAGNAT